MHALLIEKIDDVAHVILNRPEKLNALDLSLFLDLDKALQKLKKDRTLRAVILRGNGKDFCSGLDVQSVLKNKSNALRLLWKWRPGTMNLAQRVAAGWRELPVPVIAALHGRVWGGGMQIALGADFRIAHPQASLSIMESKWGLIPDMGGTLTLSENLPIDHAMKLAMSADRISSEDALQARLITEINEDPLSRAVEFANELKQKSPDTNAAIKRLYHSTWHLNKAAALSKETWYQIKILLGKNQSIAVKKQLSDPDKPWRPRLPW